MRWQVFDRVAIPGITPKLAARLLPPTLGELVGLLLLLVLSLPSLSYTDTHI